MGFPLDACTITPAHALGHRERSILCKTRMTVNGCSQTIVIYSVPASSAPYNLAIWAKNTLRTRELALWAFSDVFLGSQDGPFLETHVSP